jgi:aspartyl-tRNA(Asn)/glutamyl-tRNA(Gln) amidotransferase subunit A
MHDPFNAFVDLDPAMHGGDGPLAGLTIGVKANIAVKGLPWTAGMELYRHRIATEDAEVVKRLRAAGAAIPGALNMEEAALGAKTDNPWFGATHNPHRLGYTPGGSSGGSAAAVAAGLCDAALGTDTLGSIRIPASYCGIYGFKPANAAVSQNGLEIAEASLDVIGPLARDLDTLERVARVISDFGDGDGNVPDTQAAGMVLSDLGGVECTADVRAVFDKTTARLGLLQKATLSMPLSRLRFAGFIKTARAMAAHFADADPALISPNLASLLRYGTRRTADDWAEDQRILATLADEIRTLVARNSFMILPTAPQPAFPHSDPAPANQADFTCIASIASLPAISIPGGWSADGLPIGIQIVGQTGHEVRLFSRARALDGVLAAYRSPANFQPG